MYTIAVITYLLTGSERKPRLLMSLQSVQQQYKTKHELPFCRKVKKKNQQNKLIKRFHYVSTARPKINKWFRNIKSLFRSGTE